MSKRYPGNFITGNPVALSQSSNNGIFDLKDQYQATSNGTWQEVDGIHEIPGSLRFRSASSNSTYLAKTFSTTPTSRTTMTWSGWVKMGRLSNGSSVIHLYGTYNNYETLQIAAPSNANGWISGALRLTGPYMSGQQGIIITKQVLRDPSAWYHIVAVYDTTNPVANDRLRLYVNGVQCSAFSSLTASNQNNTTTEWLNSGYISNVGISGNSTSQTWDGEMAEVNIIDGLALDPSYFGYFDPITNIWQPKKYTGSYGNNGSYLLGNNNQTIYGSYFGAASSAQYLTTAYSSELALTNQDFTIESFVYATEAFTQNDHGIFNFGENVTSVNGKSLIITGYTGGSSPYRYLRFAASSDGANNDIANYVDLGQIELYTWNHIAMCRNAGVLSFYINGRRVYTQTIGTTSFYNQTSYGLAIGNYRNSGSFGSSNWPGAISNARVTIGQCLYSGATIVVPRAPLTTTSQGAVSSNVKLLCCQSSSATQDNSQYSRTLTNNGTTSFVDYAYTLTDMSGNGNTWSFVNHYVLNIGTNRSSTSWDILADSPTNVFTSATDTGGVVPGNYCTMNGVAAFATGGTVPVPVSGNLDINCTTLSHWQRYVGTMGIPTSGKWYWEITISQVVSPSGSGNTLNYCFGIADPTNVTPVGDGANTGWYSFWIDSSVASKVISNRISSVAYGSIPSSGDVLMTAFDRDNNKIWWGLNGTWFASGNPVTGTNAAFDGNMSTTVNYLPHISGYAYTANSQTPLNAKANFGQRPFAYTPPTGFKSLNTTNIQAVGTSAVAKAAIQPHKWMDVNVWGGTGAQRDIVNAGEFAPDLVWEKCLSTTYPHLVVDSARGNANRLIPNTTAVEADEPSNIFSLNSNGFTVGSNAVSNYVGYRNVAWQWKQSPTSGFNIITWTGTGSAQAISHNLGVSPDVIICKARDAAQYWIYNHKGMSGIGYNTYFNTVDPQQNDNQFTAKSSSTITVSGGSANASGVKYVGYLFADVPGFSKFGSYIGTGGTDGPFIYTGFRPKYIKIKSFTPGGISRDYLIYDSVRTPYNGFNTSDFASGAQSITTSVPYTGSDSYSDAVDFVSNGFKIKNAGSPNYNGNGETYVYMAFAESAFALNNRAR